MDLDFTRKWNYEVHQENTLKLGHTVAQIQNCNLKCINLLFCIATTLFGCMGAELLMRTKLITWCYTQHSTYFEKDFMS